MKIVNHFGYDYSSQSNLNVIRNILFFRAFLCETDLSFLSYSFTIFFSVSIETSQRAETSFWTLNIVVYLLGRAQRLVLKVGWLFPIGSPIINIVLNTHPWSKIFIPMLQITIVNLSCYIKLVHLYRSRRKRT